MRKFFKNLHQQKITKLMQGELRRSCRELRQYSLNVLGRDIKQDNFDETKLLYIAYSNYVMEDKNLFAGVAGAIFAFGLAYLYASNSLSDMINAALGNDMQLIFIFLGIFYVPRLIKEFFAIYSKKTTKGIERLTFELYKKYSNIP